MDKDGNPVITASDEADSAPTAADLLEVWHSCDDDSTAEGGEGRKRGESGEARADTYDMPSSCRLSGSVLLQRMVEQAGTVQHVWCKLS